MKTLEPKKKTRIGKRHRGFTLGEVVIATAIVGTLTAIAVPNYLRIKMNTNMEMVKQQLKKMGTHMNELYNQNHVFPEDVLQLGNGLDEAAITASLNAIDSFGYTTDGYTTSANRSYYRFQTCPTSNTAGDRCFFLDSLGTTEDIALALASIAAGGALDADDFMVYSWYADPPAGSFQDAQSLRDFLLNLASTSSQTAESLQLDVGDKNPAARLNLSDSQLSFMKQLLADASFVQQLNNLGLNVFYFNQPNQGTAMPHLLGFKIDPSKFGQ